jgi:glycosyltransferase involved in cell wall biosynthesis
MTTNRHILLPGYAGSFGGAETELWHMADAFQKGGVTVHLVPYAQPSDEQREAMDALGCITHEWDPALFRGQVVFALCNREFLRRLPAIREAGLPKAVVYGDTMARQIYGREEHRRGWIDYFLFQSKYQRDGHLAELSKIASVRELAGYHPYFSWHRPGSPGVWAPGCPCNRNAETFAIGRVSRDDKAKFPDGFWDSYESVRRQSPKPVHFWVMGYGPNARERCGAPPAGEHVHAFPPYRMSSADLFSHLDVMIHLTGGSSENWPRVLFEAWASRVVPIMDRDSGASEIITDGVNGFLARNNAEAAECALLLARDDALRVRMANAGAETLEREHCSVERSVAPFLPLLEDLPPVASPGLAKPRKLNLQTVRQVTESFNRVSKSRQFMAVHLHVVDGQPEIECHDHEFPPELLQAAIAKLQAFARGDSAEPRRCVIAAMTHPKSPLPGVCRETWVPAARALGFEVLFYTGSRQPCCGQSWRTRLSGDRLRLPAGTEYFDAARRFGVFARWFAENRPGCWLFDIDDDTLVAPDRLREFLPTAGDYCGYPLRVKNLAVPYASGGAGTLLSPTAVKILAAGGMPERGHDDVAIGRILHAAGIALAEDRRFRPYRNADPADNNELGPENAYIAGHCKGTGPDPYADRIALMRRLWSRLQGGD